MPTRIAMVSCPKCITNNTLDSAFCRKCGATLPADVIAEEQIKLKEIVTKGMESFQNGNSDEAMAIAEHSILTNPSFAEAYALKGMVHERRAQYAEALDSYETVVALQPDSTLDKIKLNQLRNAFAQRQAAPAEPDRKSALLMSGAAVVALAAIGFGVYWVSVNSKSSTQTQATNTPLVATNTQTYPAVQSGPTVKTVPNPVGTPPTANTGNAPGDVEPVTSTPNRTQNPGTQRNFPRPNFGSRNNGSSSNSGIGENVSPLPVNNSGDTTNPGGNQIPTLDPATEPKPRPVDPEPTPTNPKQTNSNSDNPGSISVSVTKTSDEDQARRSLENAGSVRMQTNDTEGASKAYNSASNRAGASGKTHQRAGQSLMRSGKKTEAISAFERAISAYEKEMQNGKGDKASIQAGLNSCKQALKTLKSD